MNKDGTRCGAAGLRRSAIVERLRLREEWSELKEIPNKTEITQKPRTKARKQHNTNTVLKTHKNTTANKIISRSDKSKEVSEILRGIVVLVEVGSEPRALPLRAALSALGASVVPVWSPLVTHLVWTQGGCRSTRAKARVLGCSLVSPLWVEACAVQGRKLSEKIFPASTRPSDLPSPATLRRFLKKAEQENIPLHNLLNDSSEADKRPTLRLSSDTSRDTSHDTSRDTSRDTSKDTSHDATDIESRVNTAPKRRALVSTNTQRPVKSKRKLFTQKEPELQTTDEDIDDETAGPKNMQPSKITQQDRKDLAKAERMARLLMGTCKTIQTIKPTQYNKPPRIVLTGMSRVERCEAWQAIKQLNGKVQQYVDRKTTHVIMGSCQKSQDILENAVFSKPRTVNALLGAARGCRVVTLDWAKDSLKANRWLPHNIGYEIRHLKKISQKARVERSALNKLHSEYAYDVFNGMRVKISPDADQKDAIAQLLTLCGAVIQNEDQPNVETTQKSGKNGAKIKFSDLISRIKNQSGRKNYQLTQNGRRIGAQTQNSQQVQDGATLTADFDLTVGKGKGEVSSKWVFDSVAAARMRTTRRYIND
ncbi:microcephalin [Maniola jurtina]|uniref:microcephalin n=1 Tax=Maniola jurtina TaxID=191418 RepID=UPI001E688F82|nr:microcephalin [Maniola jurtina]XP_045779464.1 microcephalin [Maniola jurtina]